VHGADRIHRLVGDDVLGRECSQRKAIADRLSEVRREEAALVKAESDALDRLQEARARLTAGKKLVNRRLYRLLSASLGRNVKPRNVNCALR
jgi:hypothetical protein